MLVSYPGFLTPAFATCIYNVLVDTTSGKHWGDLTEGLYISLQESTTSNLLAHHFLSPIPLHSSNAYFLVHALTPTVNLPL